MYLHVPFCFHKCHYCDFFSLVEPKGREDRQEAFTEALIRELNAHIEHYQLKPQTLFVGGGTPTLLRPQLWQRLLGAISDAGVLDSVAEFTVEANPETVSAELMHILAEGGVNRLSMGAQSFNPQHLKTLERWHDPETVPRAMLLAREAGIQNLNLDLIFAIPGQTLNDLDQDLDTALQFNPTHLSCYSLIFEPNTPLTQKMKLGRISPVGEEIERDMYDHVMNRLEDADFEHYEISNWAKRVPNALDPETELSGNRWVMPGCCCIIDDDDVFSLSDTQSPAPETRSNICRHNLIYWHNKNWLGLGPSAASHINGHRWKNEPHLGRYIAGSPSPPTLDHEQLPPRRRLGEQIMLGLRLRLGVQLDWLQANLLPDDPRHATIDELIQIGMLEKTESHLRLTRRGLFLADSVIAKLL